MAVFSALLRLLNSQGKPQQKVVFRHPAPTLDRLVHELNSQEFVLVEELLWEAGGVLRDNGQTILSRRAVAKVRLWKCAETDAAMAAAAGAADA